MRHSNAGSRCPMAWTGRRHTASSNRPGDGRIWRRARAPAWSASAATTVRWISSRWGMARKTREVVVTDGGRDDGKHFIITELPASQAERWAARALMAMVRADVELPEDFETTGIAGLVTLSL